MAWVTPSNVATGDVLTAATWNQSVVANAAELAPFFGAWTSWTPTLKQSATPTQTNTRSRYVKVGKTVFATYVITIGSGTAGTSGQAITLDFSNIGTAADAQAVVGGFRHFDAGSTNYVGIAVGSSTTVADFAVDGYGAQHGGQPVQLTNGDIFRGWLMIELA